MFKSLSGRDITLVRVKSVCQRMPLSNDGTFLDAHYKNSNMKRGSARRYVYVCDFYLEVSDSNISIVVE